jgi:LacI family transcriptional regulator
MALRGTTIRDVALKAGVSVGTVSKVFNNKGKLTDETKQRVLTAAASLNFSPNALIRSLQQGKTNTIGVYTWRIRTDPSRDITMHLLKGITDGIAEAGYDTLLYSHLPEHLQAVTSASQFLDGRVDGLVVTNNNITRTALESLAQAGLPTVVLYGHNLPEGLGYVDVDNQRGVQEAVAHLIGLGHRRIAFFNPYFTSNYADRRSGYLAALAEAKIPHDPHLTVAENEQGKLSLEMFCQRLFSQPEPATALVLGDDVLAFEALSLLSQWGKRVPEEVSVVGFDDVAAAMAPPGLATIRQPAAEIGQTAIRFLQQLIAGESADKCQAVLPVTFIPRPTIAPPPTRKR